MTTSEALTQLNIRIGDTDNFTFTAEEKQQAILEAYNDDYVVSQEWDDSLTFSSSSYEYTNPLTSLQDIYIRPDNGTDEPEPISSGLWEVVDDKIHFKKGSDIIPDGATLYLKGKTKYTSTDDIIETSLQEYILSLAQLILYRMLGTKKAFRFIKNDTSVSEIIGLKRELEREVQRYRNRQPVSFESA